MTDGPSPDTAETVPTPPGPAKSPPPGPFSALGLGVIAFVVLLDQGTKWLAENRLGFADLIEVLPFLALYRTYNTGVAFSLFAGFGSAGLIAAMLVITAVVLWIWVRSQEGGWLATIGYALIVGGAIGNLIDRVAYGHVIDFLLLHSGGRTLFVFNLADTALSIGPALVLLVLVFGKR